MPTNPPVAIESRELINCTASRVWDVRALNRFIADPEGEIPGTSMSAPPVRDAQDRADIIAYLTSLELHNRP